MSDDLEIARLKRGRRQLADAAMKELGVDAERLAALTESAPEEIRDAILDGLERAGMYRTLALRQAAEDEAEGVPGERCCNAVCPEYRQSEGQEERPSDIPGAVEIVQTGRRDFCARGAAHAQGCVFHQRERPPSDPFRRLPSHAEALRMLMRAGLLEPDEFGKYDGTDFALRENTRRLWWAFIGLLVETGRIPGGDDRGAQSDAARAMLRALDVARAREASDAR